jgi:hypothetical protein
MGAPTIKEWIDILQTIKWPLVAIAGLLIFRKTIANLVGRLNKFGFAGTTFDATQSQTADQADKEEASQVDRAIGLFRAETIDHFNELVSNEIDLPNIKTDKEAVDILYDYATVLCLMKYFDSVYYSIYGSQITLLQRVNGSAESPESLKRFYDQALRGNPKFFDNYPFEQYMQFLFSHMLITEKKGKIGISIIGVDFLKNLAETSKPLDKAF